MKDIVFKLRVSSAELESWRREAMREGRSIANWIRARLAQAQGGG